MRRPIKILLLLALPLAPLALLGLLVEGAPALPANPTLEAGDAALARSALLKLKYVLDPDIRWSRFAASEAELNGVLAVAARSLPGLRGRARVSPAGMTLLLSARLPIPLAEVWLNLTVTLRPGRGPLRFEAVRLGRLTLPARLVAPLVRLSLNAVLGQRLGDAALAGLKDLTVLDNGVLVKVVLSLAERRALLDRGKKLAGALAPAGDAGRVRAHFGALVRAAEFGRLPDGGSLAPYLRFALAEADRRTAAQQGAVSVAVPPATAAGLALAEARAAILALAVYCGHWRVQYLVGEMIKGEMAAFGSRCGRVTLAGRGDLRQHFAISAALEVASSGAAAFSVGEFKELLDANPRGSGFSFDDLAADRAGIRFAARVLEAAADPATRAALIASLSAEGAVFPDIAGLPEAMPDVDFKEVFDDVDSPRYRAILALIDRRIDRLAFYAP